MRRPQRPVQQRCREPVAERKDEQEPEDERQGERQRAERKGGPAVALELVEVELEPGEEHEVQQPQLAERLDDALALDPVEDEWSDERSAEHDPDEPGQAESLRDDGPEEQHESRDEERPFGGLGRKLDRDDHSGSVTTTADSRQREWRGKRRC